MEVEADTAVFPSSEATVDEDELPPTGRNVDFDNSESFTSGLLVNGLFGRGRGGGYIRAN